MNININPMWFYWLEVVDKLCDLCTVVAVLAAITTITLISVGIMNIKIPIDQTDMEKGHAMLKFGMITGVACIIFCIAAVFIPNKETLIEMQVAKLATKENGEAMISGVKEAIDYIFMKIGELK